VDDPERRIRDACEAGRFDVATTLTIETYGGELLGYLAALVRDAIEADDLFASICEQLWTSIPEFRWDCSMRTFAYTLARSAWCRLVRDPRRKIAKTPLSDAPLSAVMERVRTATAAHMKTESKDRLAELRAELDPDDQTLLILRINRKLAWREIAIVMADGEDVERKAAALRKRFERLKVELREKLAAQ